MMLIIGGHIFLVQNYALYLWCITLLCKISKSTVKVEFLSKSKHLFYYTTDTLYSFKFFPIFYSIDMKIYVDVNALYSYHAPQ